MKSNWLKDRPIVQMTINAFLTLTTLLIMFWFSSRAEADTNIKTQIQTLQEEKAPYSYVDKELEAHKENNIKTNADQDLKLETVRKEWMQSIKDLQTGQEEILKFMIQLHVSGKLKD